MSDTKNKSISLPRDDAESFAAIAKANGMSLSAWLVAAGRKERARESARIWAESIEDPDVASDLAPYLTRTQTSRAAALRELDAA